MIKLSVILHILRDILNGDVLALIIIIDICLHLEQVDDALELILFSNGKLKDDGIFSKSLTDLVYSSVEVRTQISILLMNAIRGTL